MKAGTLVRFINRHDECMLLTVLKTDGDWAHCSYTVPTQFYSWGKVASSVSKTGWFRSETLSEVK